MFTKTGINNNTQSTYIINIDSEFKYPDYQELRFAQNNARTARNYSIIAIALALLSLTTNNANIKKFKEKT
ncbi:MAG: hypothetical protein COT80_02435 [Candidatus Buchananbacteria bacterium CG10_big_fil_rev_8_21_14_0_10_33_19]|uniref:Uncharacterized protein n=1 Tax=Candidatus Buchananbacteria bacterium CG10_big_fil_rev_8_21_14_0_10_33_19 TaxID=1974525 RepID=A0A2H0W414_9BACT|nr:MAG: hypothetical protein COT80_02435 [Candidatus Buchananbacteria bacterium CG10_big_fil_rev_8_21_14_0_10_33_19]